MLQFNQILKKFIQKLHYHFKMKMIVQLSVHFKSLKPSVETLKIEGKEPLTFCRSFAVSWCGNCITREGFVLIQHCRNWCYGTSFALLRYGLCRCRASHSCSAFLPDNWDLFLLQTWNSMCRGGGRRSQQWYLQCRSSIRSRNWRYWLFSPCHIS